MLDGQDTSTKKIEKRFAGNTGVQALQFVPDFSLTVDSHAKYFQLTAGAFLAAVRASRIVRNVSTLSMPPALIRAGGIRQIGDGGLGINEAADGGRSGDATPRYKHSIARQRLHGLSGALAALQRASPSASGRNVSSAGSLNHHIQHHAFRLQTLQMLDPKTWRCLRAPTTARPTRRPNWRDRRALRPRFRFEHWQKKTLFEL